MSVWPTMNTLAALAICSANTTTDCAMAALALNLEQPGAGLRVVGRLPLIQLALPEASTLAAPHHLSVCNRKQHRGIFVDVVENYGRYLVLP